MFQSLRETLSDLDVPSVIEERIVHRTGGNIQDLRVESDQSGVVIYGHTPRYRFKQEAIAAAREVMDNNRLRVEIYLGE